MLLEWVNQVQPEDIERRGRKITVDKQIKICPRCNRAWENVNRRNHPTGFTVYPVGIIPTIGKQKIKCPRCKK